MFIFAKLNILPIFTTEFIVHLLDEFVLNSMNLVLTLIIYSMAFDAKFTINGTTYDALNAGYRMKRDVDSKGCPSSHVYGVEIWGTVESTDDTNIIESMFNEYKPFSGGIIFKKGNEDAKMKEFKFEKAYVIGFEESFERKNETPMTIDFKITAQKVDCNGATHEEEWPEK